VFASQATTVAAGVPGAVVTHSAQYPCLGGVCDVDLELKQAWSGWLSEQVWDFFITITFREPVARHRGLSTLYFCERTLRRFNPERLFLGLEEHVSTYMHIHGLYRIGANQPRLSAGYSSSVKSDLSADIFRTLVDTYGRSRVDSPRSQDDVVQYVTKYATKNLADYSVYAGDKPLKKKRQKPPKSVTGVRPGKSPTGSILATPRYQIQGQLVHRDGTPV